MTDNAFLAAILASPEDNSPRLIYADYLEEQGQCERAEFVRLQCELAILDGIDTGDAGGAAGPRHLSLRRREEELLSAIQDSTKAELCHGEDCFIEAWTFCRGFVHSVTCTAEDWLTHGDAILSAQPVQEVTLTTMPVLDELRHGGWMFYNDPKHERIPEGIIEALYVPDTLLSLALRYRYQKIKKWTLPPVLIAPAQRLSLAEVRELFGLPDDTESLSHTTWAASGRRLLEANATEFGLRPSEDWREITMPLYGFTARAICDCQRHPIPLSRQDAVEMAPTYYQVELQRRRFVNGNQERYFFLGQCERCDRIFWSEIRTMVDAALEADEDAMPHDGPEIHRGPYSRGPRRMGL